MTDLTVQLCTYNRAHLLRRVLEALFAQDHDPQRYEIVLVNDGSTDATHDLIESLRAQAPCRFEVIHQENAGLAKGRNVGIARAAGEIVLFIDDDILATPVLVREHVAAHAAHPRSIVRGAVINVESFDELPPPIWTPKNYSGNYFWTSNVSLPKALLDEVGPFNESFSEYGWEDLELGLRLRHAGVPSLFEKRAVVYHHKPRPTAKSVAGMVRQAKAQARTAVQFKDLHPHWRVWLATGQTPPHVLLHRALRRLKLSNAMLALLGTVQDESKPLSPLQLAAARALAREAYFEELERVAPT
ncbi:MAG TPA: glycosyltransferase [Candidatus Dormibacteraeota bacterium]|nr:glycosyltransferase [Candidatus Dormibacteraeota bacterium]